MQKEITRGKQFITILLSAWFFSFFLACFLCLIISQQIIIIKGNFSLCFALHHIQNGWKTRQERVRRTYDECEWRSIFNPKRQLCILQRVKKRKERKNLMKNVHFRYSRKKGSIEEHERMVWKRAIFQIVFCYWQYLKHIKQK